jgi:Response regulator containing a CheY-like receiver domain and an HTH DNA-binding domain
MKNIHIGIIDDHQVVINGFCSMLANYSHVKVIITATEVNTLLLAIQEQQPEVLFTDIQMPGQDGISLAKTIKKTYPQIKIIAFSTFDDTHYIKQFMRTAGSGYLLKNASPGTIIAAIDTVLEDKEYIDENLKKLLIDETLSGKKRSMFDVPLTIREREIIKMIADGLTNQQIADKIFISHRTVEKHRMNINAKLEVTNTAGLIREAIKRGVIES